MHTNKKYSSDSTEDERASHVNRRLFLSSAGLTTAFGTILIVTGCTKEDHQIPGMGDAVDLGSGDIGVLNYAYALEQLEAAFYAKVIDSPFSGMTDMEKTILTDIRDHGSFTANFLRRHWQTRPSKG